MKGLFCRALACPWRLETPTKPARRCPSAGHFSILDLQLEGQRTKRPRPSLSAPAHGHTHLPRCHSTGKHPENPKTLSPLTRGAEGY